MKLYLIIAAIILTLSGGFYLYFDWSQARIATLQADNATLSNALTLERQTNASLRQQYQNSADALRRTHDALRAIETENLRLSKLLSKHDLAELARRKPKLIEKRINDGTKKLFSEFEDLTK